MIFDQLRQANQTWHQTSFQLIRANGFFERGVYRRIDSQITWHKGNIQPASQRAIERLPEGTRSDGAIVLFTDVALRTAESSDYPADRIVCLGTEYEVSQSDGWSSHRRYTCTKVGQ